MCYGTVPMKLKHLFKNTKPAPRPLYGAIVAAARQPELYTEGGVADNPERRLSLLIIYLCLAVDRLQPVRPEEAQHLVDMFVADIEGNLREMGVSDVAIPRHMRDVEARYVNMLRDLRSALPDAVRLRTLLSDVLVPENAEVVLNIVMQASTRLAALPPERILAGEGLSHEKDS